MPLVNLAAEALRLAASSRAERYEPKALGLKEEADWLLNVLQARAVLEAAERSDRTARRLVFVTWVLAAATVALVTVSLALGG